jgi:hypothetical protein
LLLVGPQESGWREAGEPGGHEQLLWESADTETPVGAAGLAQALVSYRIRQQNARRSGFDN